MTAAVPERNHDSNFVFQFDCPFPRLVYDKDLPLSGWIVHSGSKPMHGLRAIVSGSLRRRRIYRARRKRHRPELASTFPLLPHAVHSGFLFELQLRFGSNRITFQVQDENRTWCTFHRAKIDAIPLNFLDFAGLRRLRSVLTRRLQSGIGNSSQLLARSALPLEPTSVTARPQVSGYRIRNVDLLATSKSNLFIREIVELIAAGFREAGCETRIRLDEAPAEGCSPDGLQVVVTPHEYYNLFLSQKLGFERARELTREVVLVGTEQPETEWFYSNLWWTAHARAIADISPLGVRAYRSRGLACHYLPLGYDSILGSNLVPQNKRTHDIVFLGSLTHRRDCFFAENAPFFSHHRCHIRFVPLGFAKTSLTRSYLSPEKRTELLSQTKISLNIHYSDQKYFEWHRVLTAIANGCLVVTEKCEGYGSLIPGRHFIMVDQDQLIPACDYYLENTAERDKICREAFEFVRSQFTQAQHCRAFLRDLEATRDLAEIADCLPADRAGIPLPRPLRRAFVQHTRRSLLAAIASDIRSIKQRRLEDKPSAPHDDPASLDREIQNKRQHFRQRWQEQEDALSKGETILERHENAAYGALGSPILSIVITLHNYAHFIEECVGSIEQSMERLSRPAEIVIVNDGSEDDSLARALSCQQRSRQAILVADKKWNTGLADARNKGVYLARGKYVFMMDADNLLLPSALVELLCVLENGDDAAAYTIICRFSGSSDNRLGLLSYFDWDPQILAQYPYIDAMAMFRRDVLLELQGYDNQLSQIGWFGWEDYELWLRFAINNYEVGFVANILCLYRIHPTSMIKTTARYELQLVRHLLENYGELLTRFDPQKRVFGIDRDQLSGSEFVWPEAGKIDNSAGKLHSQAVPAEATKH